jgi:leader peptidase (prepilin peptidase)/N-methyltransferase
MIADWAETLRSASGLWPWAALALGLVVGSFANVCIHRIPLRQSVVTPASRCPRCGARIAPWDNLPVLSYLLLRGRCRGCRAPISPRYPAVEAANGALYLAAAAVLGPTARTLAIMALLTALLVLALIDLDHHLLPDAITLPGVGAGLLASLLPGSPVTLRAAALAAAGGYLAFWAVARAAERYYGREALGQGDWKLAAMLGAFLGGRSLVLAVFLGSLTGALVGGALWVAGRASGRSELPLGTFLCAGGIVAALAGPPLLAWYGSLIRG